MLVVIMKHNVINYKLIKTKRLARVVNTIYKPDDSKYQGVINTVAPPGNILTQETGKNNILALIFKLINND